MKSRKTAVAASAAASKPERKIVPSSVKKGPRRKSVPPSRIVAPQELPEEYGENEVILMPVDPDVIYVDWEIGKEELPAGNTPVTMRVTGVTTDRESDASGRRVVELQLDSRNGSGFFDIGMPGREVAVEIGINLAGEFSPVIKSETVSMPLWTGPDECDLPETLSGSGGPVGY